MQAIITSQVLWESYNWKNESKNYFTAMGEKWEQNLEGGKNPTKPSLSNTLNLLYDLALIFLQHCNQWWITPSTISSYVDLVSYTWASAKSYLCPLKY